MKESSNTEEHFEAKGDSGSRRKGKSSSDRIRKKSQGGGAIQKDPNRSTAFKAESSSPRPPRIVAATPKEQENTRDGRQRESDISEGQAAARDSSSEIAKGNAKRGAAADVPQGQARDEKDIVSVEDKKSTSEERSQRNVDAPTPNAQIGEDAESPASLIFVSHKTPWDIVTQLPSATASVKTWHKFTQFMHIMCYSCKVFYNNDDNEPCMQKCGSTICTKCSKKKTDCQICSSENESGKTLPLKNYVNKDLFTNYDLVLAGVLHLGFSTHRNGQVEEMAVGDEIINNIKIELEELSRSYYKTKRVFENMEEYQKNFITECSTVNGIVNDLIHLRISLETVNTWQSVVKEFSSLEKDVNEWNNLADLDFIVFHFFANVLAHPNVQLGMRVSDFKTYGFRSISCKLDKVCLAVGKKGEEELVFPLFFMPKCIFLCCCKTRINLKKKNIFVLDFRKFVLAHTFMGIFFQIYIRKISRYLALSLDILDEESDLIRQIRLLCTGEDGPCYARGMISISEECILIKNYVNGEEYASDDIIPQIPDHAKIKILPFKGMVTVPRNYGNGACIRIAFDKINNVEPEVLIGHVEDLDILDMIPRSGDYEISASGLLFNPRG